MQFVAVLLLPAVMWCIQFLRADLGVLPAKQQQNTRGWWPYFALGSALGLAMMFAVLELHLLPLSPLFILPAFAVGYIAIPAILVWADRRKVRVPLGRLSWRTVIACGIVLSLILALTTWFIRSAPGLIPTFTYQGHHTAVTAMAWSPDGKRIASSDDSGMVHIWDAFSGKHESTGYKRYKSEYDRYTERIEGLSWSPDGMHIAVCSGTGLAEIWSTTSAAREVVLAGSGGCDSPVAWSPRGDSVATRVEPESSAGADIGIWNTATGKLLTTSRISNTSIDNVVWSPDGSRLAVLASSQVHVLDSRNGAALWSTSGTEGFQYTIAWSSDGSRLVMASADIDSTDNFQYSVLLQTYIAQSGQLIVQERRDCDQFSHIFVSSDGQFLATTDDVGGDSLVTIWNTAMLQQQFVWHGSNGANVVAWSPDGRFVASNDYNNGIEVWKLGRES